MSGRRFQDLDRRGKVTSVLRGALSLLIVSAVLIAVYVLIPFKSRGPYELFGFLLIAGVVYAATLTRQLRQVAGAQIPEVRAVHAAAVNLLLFLLLYASAYLSIAADDPGSFSQQLNHIGGMYLAITIFSTVGFGDITPQTDLARVLVGTQMLLDFVVIGIILRSFLATARSSLAHGSRGGEPDADPGAG